jgi:hypothetical protein
MLIHLVGNNISDFNFNVPKTFNKSQYIYILQGVCVFSGTIGVHSSKKGHYVYLGKRNDVWYYFNDEHYAGTVSDYKTGHYNDKRKNLFDMYYITNVLVAQTQHLILHLRLAIQPLERSPNYLNILILKKRNKKNFLNCILIQL